ncbi:HNH endonuclease [Massilia sp. GER05]|uniref:HNH endonuclease n=1 Tax=unclassified Massilia TaxID=2609279 RepID=UPI0039A67147
MARRSRIPDFDFPAQPAAADSPCPLCGRPLGTVNIDRHHLIPKSLKGREQFPIHKICHRKIHATFSERELLRTYHTWDVLKEHGDIRAFIEWVMKKPPAFYARTFTSNTKKSR